MSLTLHKVTAVPGAYAANEMYCVSSANADHFELYLTNSAGTAIRRIPTESDINTLINNAIASANNTLIEQDIAARDALTLSANTSVIVVDASGDPTVTSGAAEYLWDNANSVWIKLSEFESNDISLTWAALTGGPSSTPAAIDQAVTDSHTHANKTELDKIGQLADGNLEYDGSYVKTAFETTAW